MSIDETRKIDFSLYTDPIQEAHTINDVATYPIDGIDATDKKYYCCFDVTTGPDVSVVRYIGYGDEYYGGVYWISYEKK
jgi:hypothetical protein